MPNYCSKCGSPLKENAHFCTKCGAPCKETPQTAYCAVCGKPLPPGHSFCTACGAPASAAGQQPFSARQAYPYTQPSARLQSGKRAGGWIAAAAALVIVAALAVTGFWKPGFFLKKDAGEPASLTEPDTAPGKKDPKTAKPSATALAEDPKASSKPEDDLPDYVREMAGTYSLQFYYGSEVSYSYNILENMSIQNGTSSGSLTLEADGTGRLSYLGNDAAVTWDEGSVVVDGEKKKLYFSYPLVTIEIEDGVRLEYSKVSHRERFDLEVQKDELREYADPSLYELGEPEIAHYMSGTHPMIFVNVPIKNKSDEPLLLGDLYFTTLTPDGEERGFFLLASAAMAIVPPGENGTFTFCYNARDDGEPLVYNWDATYAAFPRDASVRIEETDVAVWKGGYRRFDAEITEVIVYETGYEASYMVYRPNGYVKLPEGTDISELWICTYCYDKDGRLVGFGPQFACESSVNPVNYFEWVPGEQRGKFQMNMNGPINGSSYDVSKIDRYEIVVQSPKIY